MIITIASIPRAQSANVELLSEIAPFGESYVGFLIEQATLENAPVKTVEIGDVEPEIFQKLIGFCYTGAAPLLRKLEFTEPLFLLGPFPPAHSSHGC